MQCEVAIYEHPENGISLFIVPETDAERQLLFGLWKHGTLKMCNGVADGSGQGFCIDWKMIEKP